MPKYMSRSEAGLSRCVHLPTEVLIQIASAILDEWPEDDTPVYQSTLHDFCLVSRQWYSAGIGFLYHRPQLARGNSFTQFANTVCPPLRAKDRKVDLGSLVQVLDLSGLVHHSSNSITARLLGRVKKNLKSFIAPRISFAFNSLAPISKCKEMTHLSLGLVAETLALSDLRKAIGPLNRLESLQLPPSMVITSDGSNERWPPHLKRLAVGGFFDLEAMPTFNWPPALESLTLVDCEYLAAVLDVTFMNQQLCTSLKELVIPSYHCDALAEEPPVGLSQFAALRYLQIPIDGMFGADIAPVFDVYDLPRSMRELVLTTAIDEAFSRVDTEEICKALRGELSQVCGFGMSPSCSKLIPRATRANIDKLVWANIDDCPENELDNLYDLGLYITES
ncbi:unnamed protein product [Penicillium salamii]|nr:unnamed protein product [Penicillium salamii]CAG8294994.1 unnamed protein product [Penicillium salamii]CAG8400703.1 unnamed protein product [Penicillium salamii]